MIQHNSVDEKPRKPSPSSSPINQSNSSFVERASNTLLATPLPKKGQDLENPKNEATTSPRSDSFSDETRPFAIDRNGSEDDASDFGEGDENDGIPKTATWQTAGLLMIADVVGAGVMSLATAFAQLGWFWAFASLLFWYVVNMYVGMLVGESREAWPRSESFMDLSRVTYGKHARIWTGLAVYTFLAFVLGDYVLILGETLQMIFYETKACSWLWTGAGVIFLFPLSFVRLLALTDKLMLLNVATILGSICIALGRLTLMDDKELSDFYVTEQNMSQVMVRRTEFIAKDLSVLSFFHSQALFAFAYMGVFIYLEIISEMKEPKDFKKSLLWLSGPFQFIVYAVTGSLGYALIGSSANGLLIKQIPKGTAYRISALLLAIHMVLTFMVKGTILSRAVHNCVSPSTAKDFSSPQAYRIFILVSTVVLVFCFFVANLVPFFDDLTAFLGAMQTPFIGFILPILFIFKARKKLQRSTFGHEICFMLIIVFWMVLLFFVGVVGSVSNIVKKWSAYGSPFKDC